MSNLSSCTQATSGPVARSSWLQQSQPPPQSTVEQGLHLLAAPGGNVPDPDGLVRRGREQPLPVDLHRPHDLVMALRAHAGPVMSQSPTHHQSMGAV